MEKNKICDRARILLIDSDENICYLLRRLMRKENYKMYMAASGRQGMEMATGVCPDLIIMDIRLEDMDGTELIKWFRKWTDCPVLVISERSSYVDKVNALYAGADDYLVKPFHEQELMARIYSALRRRLPSKVNSFYRAGELCIDFSRRLVCISGEEIHFSPVEYRILECLAQNSGAVVTYQMLLDKIWGPYAESNSRILRVNMTNIRKKIDQSTIQTGYITTIPRVGYRMIENQLETVG